jgi:2-polyprenyl-3-methyl-5-hydroxy-6-metoxy-1,4-benzoquinol methylase
MKCIVCDNYIDEKSFAVEYFSSITQKRYKLFFCEKCGIGFFEPRELDIKWYTEDVFDIYILSHLGIKSLSSAQKMFFKYFPISLDKKMKLLDVGCAEGLFIFEVSKRFPNIEVYGIDFDEKSINTAKNKFNLKNVYPLSLEEFYEHAITKNLKFDIITFFEVLEHQIDPNKFLNLCKNLLNENGYIAGSVPNWRNTFQKNGGYPPHHFLWFDKNSLYNVLKINGFNNIEILFVEYTLNELAGHMQGIIMKEWSLKIKKFIFKKLFKTKQNKTTKHELITSEKYFKALKIVRNFIFAPVAILFKNFLKNGLYFQCKK